MAVYDLESPGNYVLGAGRFFVAAEGSDDWYYLAQTADLSVSVEAERVALWDVDKATAEKLVDITTQVTRNATTSFRDINRDTLTKFFAATASDVVEAGAAAKTEDFTPVTLGSYLQLGTNDLTAPTYGWRGVSSVSIVEDPGGANVALVEGTDYEIDLTEGMIQLLKGAVNVATGDTIRVTYDVDATTTEVIQTGANASQQMQAKFISDNTEGANRTFLFPKVDLGPSGEMALKSRDTFQEVPVTFEILDPNDGRAAVYIMTKPA